LIFHAYLPPWNCTFKADFGFEGQVLSALVCLVSWVTMIRSRPREKEDFASRLRECLWGAPLR
jgi:hypothetical protein